MYVCETVTSHSVISFKHAHARTHIQTQIKRTNHVAGVQASKPELLIPHAVVPIQRSTSATTVTPTPGPAPPGHAAGPTDRPEDGPPGREPSSSAFCTRPPCSRRPPAHNMAAISAVAALPVPAGYDQDVAFLEEVAQERKK